MCWVEVGWVIICPLQHRCKEFLCHQQCLCRNESIYIFCSRKISVSPNLWCHWLRSWHYWPSPRHCIVQVWQLCITYITCSWNHGWSIRTNCCDWNVRNSRSPHSLPWWRWLLKTARIVLRSSLRRRTRGYALGDVENCSLPLGKLNELCRPCI